MKHVVVSVLIISFLGLAGCKEAPEIGQTVEVRPVKVQTIALQDNQYLQYFPARLVSQQQSDLSFRVGGELSRFSLKEGQAVVAGEVLAKLDPRDASVQLELAQSRFDLAIADYNRVAKVYSQGLTSESEYEAVLANKRAAQSALDSARDALKYTELRAPFSGVIAKLHVENYQSVRPGQAVISLQNLRRLEAHIQVPESQVAAIALRGQALNFQPILKVGSIPGPIALRFKELSSQVNPGSQTYTVVYQFDAPDQGYLLPGMSGTVELNFSAVEMAERNVLAVLPVGAFKRSDESGASQVWVYSTVSQSIELRDVSVGEVRPNGVEVLSGLEQGEHVIVAGAALLNANMVVRVLNWERGL